MTPLVLLVLAASPADEAAVGTRLLNRGDHAAAVGYFRDALKGNAPQAVHHIARHGLALCLAAADPPDWKQALDLLHGPAGDGNYPDRGDALELLGVGYRARAKEEGDGRRWDAHRWFSEASRWFANKKRLADAARCRCAAAELDLLLSNPQAARAGTEVFLKEREWATTPSGGRGLHLHALAAWRLNDPSAAERAAGRVPPGDPAFADAQGVLGKVRLRASDATEAAALFRAAGDRFMLGVLAFEAGRFDEALAIFEGQPGDDVAMWAGATLVRLGRFADAVKRLEPLTTTDQTARWLGEAQLGAGQTDAGLASLRTAVELVGKVEEHRDPAVRERRHDTRIALADALMRAGKPAEADDLFRRVWDEGGRPKRRDELLARLVLTAHQAGKPDLTDSRAYDFRRQFPTSPLLADVARIQAQLAVGRALVVGPEPRQANERKARAERALDLCQVPELADDPATRVGLATVLRRAGRFAEAADAVRDIPAATLLRGDCLLRAGDAAGAATALASADSPAAKLALGHALLAAGRPAEARDVFATLTDTRAKADRALAAWQARDAAADVELERMTDSPTAAVHLAVGRLRTLIILSDTNHVRCIADEVARRLADIRGRQTGSPTDDAAQLLAYWHGLALLKADKVAEARAVFESFANPLRGWPAGAAFSRMAGESRLAVEAAKSGEVGRNATREAAEELVRRAEELRDQPGAEDIRPHLYLLACRTLRTLAAGEVARAWDHERRHRRHQWADRGDGPPPVVTRRDVPRQGAEHRATDIYKRLADELPTTAHAAVARLEAAAMHVERGDLKSAAALLADGNDNGLSPDLVARRRVALADVLAARDDLPAAAAAVEGVDHPVAADRLVALWLALSEPMKAVETCGSSPSVRLGEALAAAGRLDQAAAVFAKCDGSAARYGAGWVAVKRGRLDETADHLSVCGEPRGRLLLGLVRAAQGRRDETASTLLAIRTGDAVEWAARLEACRLLGDTDGLQRLFAELPADSEWAIAVGERLP